MTLKKEVHKGTSLWAKTKTEAKKSFESNKGIKVRKVTKRTGGGFTVYWVLK
jgi:hypothetical protein